MNLVELIGLCLKDLRKILGGERNRPIVICPNLGQVLPSDRGPRTQLGQLSPIIEGNLRSPKVAPDPENRRLVPENYISGKSSQLKLMWWSKVTQTFVYLRDIAPPSLILEDRNCCLNPFPSSLFLLAITWRMAQGSTWWAPV